MSRRALKSDDRTKLATGLLRQGLVRMKEHRVSSGRIVVTLLMIFAAVSAATAGPATAATARELSCIPGRTGSGNEFDGWYRNLTGLIDTNAYVTEYSPYVAYDGTFAWVMLYNNSSPALYAQAGWLKYYSGSRYKFAEWTYDTSGHWTRHVFSASPLGSSNFYEVYWDGANARLDYIENGQIFDTSPRVFTMRQAQQFGEIHSPGSQMPGGYSDHVVFSSAQVVSSTQVYNFSGTVLNYNSLWFGNSNPSSTQDEIWDTACFS